MNKQVKRLAEKGLPLPKPEKIKAYHCGDWAMQGWLYDGNKKIEIMVTTCGNDRYEWSLILLSEDFKGPLASGTHIGSGRENTVCEAMAAGEREAEKQWEQRLTSRAATQEKK